VNSAPAHIGLVLTGAARDALATALVTAGFQVHTASTLDRVRALVARGDVDAWIFDAQSDEVLELLLGTGRFLLPADNIPPLENTRAVSAWAQGLLAQLDVALSTRAAHGDARTVDRWGEVRGVWLLAGSAGATSAVQDFLDAFTRPPPVAFLYAQHLDPTQRSVLQRFTPRNRQFALRTSEGVRALEPASLIMVSPRYKVVLNPFGQLTTTRQPWSGPHTPDINELLVILGSAQLPSPGVIVFSGMGNDGVDGLRIFEAAGGRVWAQSPASAVCPAMPQAALDTALVQRCGEPAALARALENLYTP
jgi:chemotaxis response regulator CheB